MFLNRCWPLFPVIRQVDKDRRQHCQYNLYAEPQTKEKLENSYPSSESKYPQRLQVQNPLNLRDGFAQKRSPSVLQPHRTKRQASILKGIHRTSRQERAKGKAEIFNRYLVTTFAPITPVIRGSRWNPIPSRLDKFKTTWPPE